MKQILVAVLLLVGNSLVAQTNLVRNPSFELYSECPHWFDEIGKAQFWSAIDSTGAGPCTPELCHTCANGSNPLRLAEVPIGHYYWQYPRTGNGMAQVGFYFDDSSPGNANLRDYMQGRLSRKLSAGKSYCVSFYVCLDEGSGYAVKDIEAYLDNGTIDTTHTCGNPQTQYHPQISNSGGIITDTARWTKISGSFVANGTESFITIGNFRDKAGTTWAAMPHNNNYHGAEQYSVYLIDDVSVVESGSKANAGLDTHVGQGDSVFIGIADLGIDCIWTKLGSSTVIGTAPGIWVKPSVATSYVVTQNLCGTVTKDTVKVDVWKLGVNETSTHRYTLLPNPNRGIFQLQQSTGTDEAVDARIYNIFGQSVWMGTIVFKGETAQIDFSTALAAGNYYLHLKDGNGRITILRFLKQ